MINETLKQLGFSDKESEVFMTVIKHGKIIPADVAKITGISRPTVYSVIKTLIKKGAVLEDVGTKNLYVMAKPLSALPDLLDGEKNKLKEKENLIKTAIAELSPLTARVTYSIPKIRFIEEGDVRDYLYKQIVTWNDSAKIIDGIWWGFQDHTFAEVFKEWINHIWKNVHPDGHVKLLSNQSNIEKLLKGKYKGREIKYWDKAKDFTASTWVVGEYLIMIVTRQKPFYLVEIRDAVLAHNMCEVFKNIWDDIK